MHPLILNIKQPTAWPMQNESRNEDPGTRINLFAMTLVRPYKWSPSGKTVRPQFCLCIKGGSCMNYFTSSDNYF